MLAGTGILQTALAATDAVASRDCLASVQTPGGGKADCSRADGTDNNSRAPFRSLAYKDGPPQPKASGASPAPELRLSVRADRSRPGPAGWQVPTASVFLVTRRLRI